MIPLVALAAAVRHAAFLESTLQARKRALASDDRKGMTVPLKRVWRRKRRRLENQSREEESRSASNRAVGVAQNVMVSGYALFGCAVKLYS